MYNNNDRQKEKKPTSFAQKRAKKLGSFNGTPLVGRKALPSVDPYEEAQEDELEHGYETRESSYTQRVPTPSSAVVHGGGGGRHDQSPYMSSPLRSSSSTPASDAYYDRPFVPPRSIEARITNIYRDHQMDRSTSVPSRDPYYGVQPSAPQSASGLRERTYAASPLRSGSVPGPGESGSRFIGDIAPHGHQYTQEQGYGGDYSYDSMPQPPPLHEQRRMLREILKDPEQPAYDRRPGSSMSSSSASHGHRQRTSDVNELNGLMDNLALSQRGHPSPSPNRRMGTPDQSTYHARDSPVSTPKRRDSANTGSPRITQQDTRQDQARYTSGRSSSNASSRPASGW